MGEGAGVHQVQTRNLARRETRRRPATRWASMNSSGDSRAPARAWVSETSTPATAFAADGVIEIALFQVEDEQVGLGFGRDFQMCLVGHRRTVTFDEFVSVEVDDAFHDLDPGVSTLRDLVGDFVVGFQHRPTDGGVLVDLNRAVATVRGNEQFKFALACAGA